ncbi:chemotaxis protein [Pseudolabrys taiwanensis]|uniref:Chemotaxis protein n=1 Tax=Pseudolabrys taiwanensis TaxID=331696 RepID=A0A345ZXT5_9HYPH|nr:chemotaxis protein [Pseudolabrys taiwanensis]AXK81732.1 chemotaxis protein [Pseudolabrys taiwanensis]
MNTFGAIIVAMLLSLAAARAEDAHAAPEPHQLVRRLQSLQDEIARGNLDAHNAQPALLKRLGEKFHEADPAVWNEARNGRAVVTFLLSGGAPQVVRDLRARVKLNIDEAILDGALAYVEGRSDEAKARLADVNVRTLPPTFGAQIALVQSALVAQSDPKQTIERLDEARLLLPGTLVEEAALRREIFVTGQVDDFDKFESLAIQYFRRYRHSIYSGNFRQRFALAVARFSFAQQTHRFARLVAILEHLDRASQRTLYLLIARTALVHGKIDMADLSAERAETLAEAGSTEQERARLYRASVRALRKSNEEAVSDLKKIDKGRLPQRDAELLAAALTVGGNVRRALPSVSAPPDTAADDQTAVRPRIDFGTSLATLDQAEQLLKESDAQLKETNR